MNKPICICHRCAARAACPCEWYGIDLEATATFFGDGERCLVDHDADGCAITAYVPTEERARQIAEQWTAEGQLARVSFDGCPADHAGPAEWYVYGYIDAPTEWREEQERAEGDADNWRDSRIDQELMDREWGAP